jgi:YHS domain-containing protein
MEPMMKALLLAILPFLLVSCDKEEAKPAATAAPVEKAKDTVCEMMIPKATAIKVTHEGADYYFCGQACVDKFKADPKKYAVHCTCANTKKACSCDHCGGTTPCDCVK